MTGRAVLHPLLFLVLVLLAPVAGLFISILAAAALAMLPVLVWCHALDWLARRLRSGLDGR